MGLIGGDPPCAYMRRRPRTLHPQRRRALARAHRRNQLPANVEARACFDGQLIVDKTHQQCFYQQPFGLLFDVGEPPTQMHDLAHSHGLMKARIMLGMHQTEHIKAKRRIFHDREEQVPHRTYMEHRRRNRTIPVVANVFILRGFRVHRHRTRIDQDTSAIVGAPHVCEKCFSSFSFVRHLDFHPLFRSLDDHRAQTWVS